MTTCEQRAIHRQRLAAAFLLITVLSGCAPTLIEKPPEKLPPGVKGYREVFFATDRKPLGEATFGNEASDDGQVTYGRAIVSIPLSHETGELERPWHVFSVSFPENAKRHILIAQRERRQRDDFLDRLRDAIDASPEKSAFVFVHGYNNSFDFAVLRTGQLAFDLKFRGPALTYSWPSQDRFGGYVEDIDMVDWAAPHLEAFLRDVRQRTGARTIHLIAHSMGARLLSFALERLAHAQPGSPPHFQEVILAAPDINAKVLAQLDSAMRQDSDRVTLYASSGDIALGFSAAIRGERTRAGGSASNLPPLPGFDIIDATRINFKHAGFAENPLMLNDLALLMKQRLGPDQRSVTLEQSGNVWVFR